MVICAVVMASPRVGEDGWNLSDYAVMSRVTDSIKTTSAGAGVFPVRVDLNKDDESLTFRSGIAMEVIEDLKETAKNQGSDLLVIGLTRRVSKILAFAGFPNLFLRHPYSMNQFDYETYVKEKIKSFRKKS